MIEPKVPFWQVLKVPASAGTVGSMQDQQEKVAFSVRLNEIVAEATDMPEKFKGLQVTLARRFGVSQKASRKWLEGEGFPTTEKCIEIAKWANVHFEWLMTGRGPKYLEGVQSEASELLPPEIRSESLDYLRYLAQRHMTGQKLGAYLRWLDRIPKRANG